MTAALQPLGARDYRPRVEAAEREAWALYVEAADATLAAQDAERRALAQWERCRQDLAQMRAERTRRGGGA